MEPLTYLNFDLAIYHREPSGYYARVVDSPGGSSEQPFEAPFQPEQLRAFFEAIGQPRTRRAESPELSSVKSFGDTLYQTVFSGQTLSCLRASLDEAARQKKGLRIRLRLTDAPGLAELPWEYLYNASVNLFLALTDETPIVRYVDLPQTARALEVSLPLRILVVIADPQDLPGLDVQREWEMLNSNLKPLQERGVVVLDCIRPATIREIQNRLQAAEYHIFHFVGHGVFAVGSQDGFLAFEDEQGNTSKVSGQELGVLLHDHRCLRLAVFNSCDAARFSLSDPFAGVAQGVVQQGVPAVIAMQFEITDRAAVKFATDFYRWIGEGFPLEVALARARQSIYLELRNVEWGTPVLYMRSPEGKIFDLTRQDVSSSDVERVQAMVAGGKEAIDKKDFQTAIGLLEDALAINPNLPEANVELAYARTQQQIQQLYSAAHAEINSSTVPEEPVSMRLLRERASGSEEYLSLKKVFYDKYLRKPWWAKLLLLYRPAKAIAWALHIGYYVFSISALTTMVVTFAEPQDPERQSAIGGAIIFATCGVALNFWANRYDRRHAIVRKRVDSVRYWLIFGALFCGLMGTAMMYVQVGRRPFSFYLLSEAAMLLSLCGVFWSCYRTRRRRLRGILQVASIDWWTFLFSSLVLVATFIVTLVEGTLGAFPRYSITVRSIALGLAIMAAWRELSLFLCGIKRRS